MSARKVSRGRGAGLGPGRRASRGRKVKSSGGSSSGCLLLVAALGAIPTLALAFLR